MTPLANRAGNVPQYGFARAVTIAVGFGLILYGNETVFLDWAPYRFHRDRPHRSFRWYRRLACIGLGLRSKSLSRI